MIKQFLLLIVFTVLCVFFKTQAAVVLHGLLVIHDHLISYLAMVFSSDPAGDMFKNVTALLLVPLLVGFLVACIFWLVKRSAMPHTLLTIWVVWVVTLVAVLAHA